MEVLIVDEMDRSVEPGATGVMMVRSRHLTAGYWEDDALTRERFSVDPSTGVTTYRGGDLARLNEQGLIEFKGRRDSAVKIGGHYVDPSEVEQALLRVSGVETAAVVAWNWPSGEAQLTAYLQLNDQQPDPVNRVRRELREMLPRHMVPPIIRILDSIPLTPQGKIDRERLRQAPPAQGVVEPPVTETEALIASAWAEEFRKPEIGRRDNFFDLGGDSLVAAVVGARIHESFNVLVPINVFFEQPVLADFARAVDGLRASQSASPLASTQVAARDRSFPLSFGQEFYWQTSQTPEQSVRHTTTIFWRILGPLDRDILHRSIDILIARHEILRTSFHAAGGQPVQQVHPAVSAPPPRYHELVGATEPSEKLRGIIRDLNQEAFDIAQPLPARFTLVRLGEDDHALLINHHHIISDGWSWNIFFRELGESYAATRAGRTLPHIDQPRQYGDYARWQRETFDLGQPGCRSELLWWVDHILSALDPDRSAYRRSLLWCMRRAPPLPRTAKKAIGLVLRGLLRVPRPNRTAFSFRRRTMLMEVDPDQGSMIFSPPPDSSGRLREFERRTQATHFSVRLAAFVAMLAEEWNTSTVAVGTYFSTRNRAVARDLFGYCANHAILAFQCDPSRTFAEFASAVSERLRAVQQHGDFPFEVLHREMREWAVRLPTIRSHASVTIPHPEIAFGDLRMRYSRELSKSAISPGFDIKFGRDDGADTCVLTFNAQLYDPQGVRAFVDRFVRFIDVISRDQDLTIADALALSGRAAWRVLAADEGMPVAQVSRPARRSL